MSFGSCFVGASYDERHQLYPERDNNSDLILPGDYKYGLRWVKIGVALSLAGVLVGIIGASIRHRSRERDNETIF